MMLAGFPRSIGSVFRFVGSTILLATQILSVASCTSESQELHRYAYSRGQMGTTFRIVLYAPDSSTARLASEAAFARVEALDRTLSDYRVDSELNKLSLTSGSDAWVRVSDDLWAVLRKAQQISIATDGAFDVTVGPLTKLWRYGMRRNELPPAEEIEEARRAVGYRYIEFDTLAQSVYLAESGMRLDLGGIAKGYAADEVLWVLHDYGIRSALIDAGGDLRLSEAPPGSDGWKIAASVATDDDRLSEEHRYASNIGVATSGATYKYIDADGVRYSHILDPRTGMGLVAERLVTVVASNGMEADALASALSVMGAVDGLAFMATMPDAAARFVEKTDGVYRQEDSPGFDIRFSAERSDRSAK